MSLDRRTYNENPRTYFEERIDRTPRLDDSPEIRLALLYLRSIAESLEKIANPGVSVRVGVCEDRFENGICRLCNEPPPCLCERSP